MYKIKQILKDFFYTYILGRPVTPRPVTPRHAPEPDQGLSGALGVSALLVRDTDQDRLILVVDTDLHDVPVWADWDRTQNVIGIAQQNGAYATLSIKIEKDQMDMLKMVKRITVVTKVGDMNIVHHVPFIVRD